MQCLAGAYSILRRLPWGRVAVRVWSRVRLHWRQHIHYHQHNIQVMPGRGLALPCPNGVRASFFLPPTAGNGRHFPGVLKTPGECLSVAAPRAYKRGGVACCQLRLAGAHGSVRRLTFNALRTFLGFPRNRLHCDATHYALFRDFRVAGCIQLQRTTHFSGISA